LNGITPRLIESHYETNYGSAVRQLNSLTEELEALDPATAPGESVSRLKRDQSAMLNSTLLHELYFASLGGDGRAVPEAMAAALARDFGSVDRWRREFMALAEALAGGSGWVLLTWVPRDGRLVNQSAVDHGQSIAGGIPILALDMYEHAYHIDFGAKIGPYIDAFIENIHWERVAARHRCAAERVRLAGLPATTAEPEVPTVTVGELRRVIDQGEVFVLDVRHQEDFDAWPDMLPGAVHRDARRLDEWVGDLPKDREIVVHCAYGFEIGRDAGAELRRQGFGVRVLAGGISTWRAMGAPTVPKS
jgi:Fe-Mn family superoxide dismutase